jgi:alpha-methylacyl-CoA racemase
MTGPLAGLRVIEFAGIGPGPYACLLLAELGAEVIRIDRPRASGLDTAALNRSRPNLAIDLKNPAGVETALRLVESADVVVEGLRPGVMERLGLGPTACLERNPRLVYGRMTGWGQSGPMADRAGHDITYAALSGALHASGSADKPRNALNLVADFGGGSLFLVMGVLAAIFERGVSGKGQVVDAAMVDGASSLMTMIYGMKADGLWQDRREANLLDGGTPFYDTYECADGRHVAVGALEPQFYAELMKGTGLNFEQFDIARWPQMRAALSEAFKTRTRDEWAQIFDPTDACVAPVLSLEEAPTHPHNVARGIFAPYNNGQVPRVAPVFSRTPGLSPGEVREPGQDTRAVLLAAGFGEDEVEVLLAQGAVTQS